jgi:hypothetical protein
VIHAIFNPDSRHSNRYFNAISTPFQRHFNAISPPFQRHLPPYYLYLVFQRALMAWTRDAPRWN